MSARRPADNVVRPPCPPAPFRRPPRADPLLRPRAARPPLPDSRCPSRMYTAVGNLPMDIRERDVEDLFYKYGRIRDIDLKTPNR